jgi:hypothetical protein
MSCRQNLCTWKQRTQARDHHHKRNRDCIPRFVVFLLLKVVSKKKGGGAEGGGGGGGWEDVEIVLSRYRVTIAAELRRYRRVPTFFLPPIVGRDVASNTLR